MAARDSSIDVIIIGAGISGIDAAYRIQKELPKCTYAILEARASIGGTWDLFRYPGVRSDTDMHCFAFPWRPWKEQHLLADGATILQYLTESAVAEGIDQNIRFRHKVLSANWSSADQTWDLLVFAGKETSHFYCKSMVIGCGYYDYEKPLEADIPGLSKFQGRLVHPQFWPDTLDYREKRLVVIGSGATAISLTTSCAEQASHVIMLQRSPTYIMPLSNDGKSWLGWFLPAYVVSKILRLQLMIIPMVMYAFCRWFPSAARRAIRSEAVKCLGDEFPVDKHFRPVYDPWDQRLCFCPDGDFYRAIRSGKVGVITGHIEKIGPSSIILLSGEEIQADIIVTATGLRLAIAGGMQLYVDGSHVNLAEKVFWRNSWLQDIPNCAFVLGYTNASWTLGADTTAILFCRMMKTLRSRNLSSAVPRSPGYLNTKPYFDIKSTYAQKGAGSLPKTGDKGPWRGRTKYFLDSFRARFGTLSDGIRFYDRFGNPERLEPGGRERNL